MADTVRSFARGLRVIRASGPESVSMTLAEVARAAELNRATARRLLQTLEELGYVRRNKGQFRLTARVLTLGYAYLSSFGVPELALPYLEELSEEIHESTSVGVLEGTDVVYVARVPATRIMTVSIGLGSRFPAYRTSLGRALLAGLPDERVVQIWEDSDHTDTTPKTVRTVEELLADLDVVRTRGWALVDQELEMGVRSIATPITSANGTVLAAVNVSSHVVRTSEQELQENFLPKLLDAAKRINDAVAEAMM